MPWQPRRLRLENLESRRLLAAVSIADDLTAEVGAEVSAPVLIDSAQGVRGAEIRIQYDPAILTLTAEDVTAGSAWGAAVDTQVVANVDQATGTVIVSIAAANSLPDVQGSLVNFAFGVRDSAPAGSETVIDLSSVRLNEGSIVLTPAPVPGADPTDGRITLAAGQSGPADRIAGFVYADTNNDNLPGVLEGIPGVEIILIHLQTNSELRTVTQSNGAFEFTQLTAGSYRITQTHPLAYLDGGPNTVTVELSAGQSLGNQNFRELGLRPQFVYNRLLNTASLPVASTAWIAALEQINHDAVKATLAPVSSAFSGSAAATATVSSTAASQPVSASAQSPLGGETLAPPPSLPEGEAPPAGGVFAEHARVLAVDERAAPPPRVAAPPPRIEAPPQRAAAPPQELIGDRDDDDGHGSVDRAFIDPGLW